MYRLKMGGKNTLISQSENESGKQSITNTTLTNNTQEGSGDLASLQKSVAEMLNEFGAQKQALIQLDKKATKSVERIEKEASDSRNLLFLGFILALIMTFAMAVATITFYYMVSTDGLKDVSNKLDDISKQVKK